MIETIVALSAAYLLTWQALVALLILGILFENNGHRRTALFVGIVALVISYLLFDVSLLTLGLCTVGYTVIGVLWSFWRYQSYVKVEAERIRQMVTPHFGARQKMVKRLAPSQNLEKITAWIIIWPVSLIENLLGDLIRAVNSLVTRVFKGAYHRIFTAHTADLMEDISNED